MGRGRSRLGIDDFVGGLKEESTAFAGAALLIELYRQAGVGDRAEKVLPQKRSPHKGLSGGQMVECFILLPAQGGGRGPYGGHGTAAPGPGAGNHAGLHSPSVPDRPAVAGPVP